MSNDTHHDDMFPWQLKSRRDLAGVSQQQLADELASRGVNISKYTLGKIESGARKVRLGEAYEIASALGLTLDELMSGLQYADPTEEAARSVTALIDISRQLDRLLDLDVRVQYAEADLAVAIEALLKSLEGVDTSALGLLDTRIEQFHSLEPRLRLWADDVNAARDADLSQRRTEVTSGNETSLSILMRAVSQFQISPVVSRHIQRGKRLSNEQKRSESQED